MQIEVGKIYKLNCGLNVIITGEHLGIYTALIVGNIRAGAMSFYEDGRAVNGDFVKHIKEEVFEKPIVKHSDLFGGFKWIAMDKLS